MQASSDTKGPAQPAAAVVSQSDAAAESITLYHWLVVFFASCGWLFDCMGQRIFVLSREPALQGVARGHGLGRRGEILGWHRHTAHDGRLGHRRHPLRHDERPLWAGEGHGQHAAGLHGLLRAVRLCAHGGGVPGLPVPVRPGRGRDVRRRDDAGGGERAAAFPHRWRSARCRLCRRAATCWPPGSA